MPSRSTNRYYIHQLCIIYIFIYNWRISYSYIFSRVSLQLVYLPSNRVNCFHRKDANVHHYTSPLFPLRWVRRSQHFSTKINKVKAVWSSLLSDLLIRCLLAPCSMSLSVSLCGVSILPQFCRNSAAILPQFAAMVCWLCCGVLSVFIPKYSKYLTESDKCALRVLSRKSVLLLQGRISVLLLCGRILVKHLWFHSEWKTEKRREKWREVKRSKLTWAYMSLHQAGSLKGSEYLSQV